ARQQLDCLHHLPFWFPIVVVYFCCCQYALWYIRTPPSSARRSIGGVRSVHPDRAISEPDRERRGFDIAHEYAEPANWRAASVSALLMVLSSCGSCQLA